MPFTVSHIAAVVPLYRPLARLQVFSAAVIGSMVPDFGMLLPGSLERWQTHSLPALFTFCLPVGLCAWGLTQLLVTPAVLEVLPNRPYARLRADHPNVSWTEKRLWLTAIAILLGALSHLIWDAFTHENARSVRMFPRLYQQTAGHYVQLYYWLQYGSSVFGLLVVGAALTLWVRNAQPPLVPPPRRLLVRERRFWIALYLALPLAGLMWVILRPWSMGHFPFATGQQIDRIAIAGMRAAGVSLLVVSALIRIRLTIGPDSTPPAQFDTLV